MFTVFKGFYPPIPPQVKSYLPSLSSVVHFRGVARENLVSSKEPDGVIELKLAEMLCLGACLSSSWALNVTRSDLLAKAFNPLAKSRNVAIRVEIVSRYQYSFFCSIVIFF